METIARLTGHTNIKRPRIIFTFPVTHWPKRSLRWKH